jgi:four helix bundle protein
MGGLRVALFFTLGKRSTSKGWPWACIVQNMKPKLKIQHFEDLIVWQKSMSLAEEIYRVTKQGEFSKDWGLRDQIRKAVVSIPSNIAEGYGRYRAADFKRFLTIANASAYEVRSQIQLAARLGYLGALEVEMIVKDCEEVSRMVVGLRRRVERPK